MDWTLLLNYVAEAGIALAPIVASGVMLVVGLVFYQLTGFLPGIVRAYIERIYREKESLFRDSITKALINGIKSAVKGGLSGEDALQAAIDHALKTQPEGTSHFMRTSNMDRETLRTMAAAQAVDLNIQLTSDVVIAPPA